MVRTIVAIIAALLAVSSARAQTKEQWVELGTRIHGGFGVLIPIGIRIGLDAKERLKPDPRGLSVTFYSGERAPCPCIADGIMIATGASPGQATLQIAPEPAPSGLYAMVLIRNRKTGELLTELFREGTKPTSEEIAGRLGFDPLDTKPLLHEIGA